MNKEIRIVVDLGEPTLEVIRSIFKVQLTDNTFNDSTEVISSDELRSKVKTLAHVLAKQKAIELACILDSYGVCRVSDLPENDIENFYNQIKGMIA